MRLATQAACHGGAVIRFRSILSHMATPRYAKLTFVLSLIAAFLALAAAALRWFRHGTVDIALIAAALFLLAFGFGVRSRLER